jgi:putative CocE/NonD family hydrolase
LQQAHREHGDSIDPFTLFSRLPCRDSKADATGTMPHLTHSPSAYLPRYRGSVAIYHLAGWFDMWPRDALLWFHNLRNPQKIVLGPWSHAQDDGIDLIEEHLRWYDCWLKGIDNGVRDEPPIRYFVMGAPPGRQWRSAWHWPVPGTQGESYYFHPGPSGSVASVNDGYLGRTPPTPGPAADHYRVDYSTTTGRANRWTNGYGGAFGYPDMMGNDRKGLTWTTAPLQADLEVTGHPIVYLWVSSSARDGDFFVYLEEVDSTGYSHYVTEGTLRASHRALAEPPWHNLGLPYHRSFQDDLVDMPDGPAELVFDLHPTSRLFPAGSRIRVTLTCADRGNLLTPELPGPPEIRVHRDAVHPSRIVLPVVPDPGPPR